MYWTAPLHGEEPLYQSHPWDPFLHGGQDHCVAPGPSPSHTQSSELPGGHCSERIIQKLQFSGGVLQVLAHHATGDKPFFAN